MRFRRMKVKMTRSLPYAASLGIAIFSACILPNAPRASAKSAPCDRGCLLNLMNQYLDHEVAHNVSSLPVSPTANVRENTAPVKLNEGAWAKVTSIKSKQLFADPMTGQVFFWGAVEMEGGLAAM